MMSKPDSEMDGTICKECNRLISEHLPEELEECMRKTEFKKLKDDDLRWELIDWYVAYTWESVQKF